MLFLHNAFEPRTYYKRLLSQSCTEQSCGAPGYLNILQQKFEIKEKFRDNAKSLWLVKAKGTNS